MPVAIKIKRFETVGDVPNTSELVDGEIAVNIADKKIYVRDGSSIVTISGADFSAVGEDIIPDGNGTRNLGSATKRFAELFLAGETINLGGATISSDGTGTVSVSATGVTLPAESKDEDGNKLAVQGTGGRQVIRKVPFFTAAGGLSTVNKNFEFNATIDNKTAFGEAHTFTLSDGSTLTDTDPTLFQF
tara:strand:- start:314 stop:880 length:567 start_codon:yes stop_codon:yes gene_type:complete